MCIYLLHKLIVKGHFAVVLSVPGVTRPQVLGLAGHPLKSTFPMPDPGI